METKTKVTRTSLEDKYLLPSFRSSQNPQLKKQNQRLFRSVTSIEKNIQQKKNPRRAISEKVFKQGNKEDIYYHVHNFLTSLINNPLSLEALFYFLQFEQKNQKKSENKVSLRENQIIESEEFNSKRSLITIQKKKKKNKISINSIDSLFSSDSLLSLTSIQMEISYESDFRLSPQIIAIIYDSPSPFLVVESLCLLCKFLWKTKIILNNQNCVRLLAIATIISLKLLYDQQINGIHSHFGNLMNFEGKQINGLQAKFLKDIDFELDIDNHQYYILSTKILARSQD